MSGPGGPAASAVTMIPQGGRPQGAQDVARVKANIQKMIDQSASPQEIDGYVRSEGYTVDELKNSPVANVGQGGNADMAGSYNPTIEQRVRDLMAAKREGVRPAALPDNAGLGMKAIDAVEGFNNATDYLANKFTGGLSDEAGALGAATGAVLPGSANPGKFGETFSKADAAANRDLRIFAEDNPTAAGLLNLGGTLASPIFRVGAEWAAGAPTIFGRAGRAAALGGAQGAVSGAANAEGDIADRMKGAIFGAGAGAMTGGLVSPLTEGTTSLAQTARQVLNDMSAGKTNPEAQGSALLAKAFQRDNLNPATIAMEAKSRPNEALVDIANQPNVTSLARTVTAAPGQAKKMGTDYAAGRMSDMPDDVAKALRGLSNKDIVPTISKIVDDRSAASGPAYKMFYAVDPERFDTPFFNNLVKSPTGKDLLGKAYKIAELERLQGKVPYNVFEQMLDSEGNVSVKQALSPQAVDYVKQAIDQEVANYTSPMTGKVQGTLGYQWDQLRRKFLSEADTASTVNGTPLYKQARDAYAGPTAYLKAVELGKAAFKAGKLTDEKIAAFNGLSDSEKEGYRLGAAAALHEKLGDMGPNTNPYLAMLKGTNKPKLLQAIFPDQGAYDQFATTLERYGNTVTNANKYLGGSPTSRIDAEKADAVGQISKMRDLWNLLSGSGVAGRAGSVMNLMKRAEGALTGVSEDTANSVAAALFSTDPKVKADALAKLQSAIAARQTALTAGHATRTMAGANVAGFSGSVAGQLMAR